MSEPIDRLMNKEEGRICLLDVATVLDQLDVPFFLLQGTALGAYRDGGFTPTERDIDLGFLQEEFTPKAGDMAKEFVQRGYEVRTINYPYNVCRVIKLKRNGIPVDLTSYILYDNRERFCCNSDPKTKQYAIVHKRGMLENYQPLLLFGERFLVPTPITEYLELEYGPEWCTPKLDHVSRTRRYGFLPAKGLPDGVNSVVPQKQSRR